LCTAQFYGSRAACYGDPIVHPDINPPYQAGAHLRVSRYRKRLTAVVVEGPWAVCQGPLRIPRERNVTSITRTSQATVRCAFGPALHGGESERSQHPGQRPRSLSRSLRRHGWRAVSPMPSGFEAASGLAHPVGPCLIFHRAGRFDRRPENVGFAASSAARRFRGGRTMSAQDGISRRRPLRWVFR
jgi:hypothetical protein